MKALTTLHDEISSIYGYLVEVSAALATWNGFLKDQLRSSSGMTQRPFYFGKGDPNDPDAEYQHVRTWGDLVSATGEDGDTFLAHRRNVVVLVAVAWEAYRKRIADECGLREPDVTSELFADLTRCRNAIVHGGGLRRNAKVLPFFRKGDTITLTKDQIDTIFRMLVVDLNRIGREFYDSDPGFRFDKRLNP